MTVMPRSGPQPRSGARVRRWIVVAGVAAFVALYAGLAIAYLANGSQSVDAGDVDPPDGGVAVLVAARGINAATPEMDVDVEVLLSDALLNDDGNPKEQLTLTLEPTLDDADLIWPTDRRVQIRSEKVTFDGDIQDWPFDQYTSQLFAAAWVGTGADFRYVDTALYFQGSVQGWHLATGAADPSAGALLDVQFPALHRDHAVRALAGGRADHVADHLLDRRAQALPGGPALRGRLPGLDRGDAVRHHPDSQLLPRLAATRFLGGRAGDVVGGGRAHRGAGHRHGGVHPAPPPEPGAEHPLGSRTASVHGAESPASPAAPVPAPNPGAPAGAAPG